MRNRVKSWSPALKFVVLIGIMSLFTDFVYEGSRSITGPYLATLGAGAFAVAAVGGFGEFIGYGLRIFSGRLADRTRLFWPISIAGYLIQMVAVPALALAGNWPMAAALIILERVGKATRNPPMSVMISHAGKEIGYGRAFGLKEALDQFGAMVGPLTVAAVLAFTQGGYRMAFAVLAIPAVIVLGLVITARVLYPRPQDLSIQTLDIEGSGLGRNFWMYLIATALIGAGFADYSLIAFHFHSAKTVSAAWIPIFYAVAMVVSGAGALIFGHLYDRRGIRVLVPLTLVSALFAPLVFMGNFWLGLVGTTLWGLGMGVHDSLMAAAVASMVPSNRRASAYGLFTSGYGVAWFLGSLVLGALYGISITAMVIFSVAIEVIALPILWRVQTATPSQAE